MSTTTQTNSQNPPTTVQVDEQSARYWEILQHNIEWLRFSETKEALILTVFGIILTIVYTNSTAIFLNVSVNYSFPKTTYPFQSQYICEGLEVLIHTPIPQR